ncbi:hypothetical protein [Streptomyces sp. NPDC057690]|uniref:hypothetical protein n=1 Tax=Streptomyces sp. NPDC057690 TaxID=3346214 RepID=UPI0036CD0022
MSRPQSVPHRYWPGRRLDAVEATTVVTEGTYEHITPEMRRHRLDALTARWRRGRRATLRSVA